MSELINNREKRSQILQDLIKDLHAGKSVEDVRQKFAEAFDGVSAAEISEAEQALIEGGMPVSEIQRLCDVHASVFKGSIEDIHKPQPDEQTPGHPIHTFKAENDALERLLSGQIEPQIKALAESGDALKKAWSLLSEVDKHYSRKENLLFPYLERYSITAPPKVMWGVDDEIRDQIKRSGADLDTGRATAKDLLATVEKVREMIFKEDNILFPMAMENLKPSEWSSIAAESPQIGFCLIDPPPVWQATGPVEEDSAVQAPAAGRIILPTGNLSVRELEGLLNTLPFDITFVDKDDTVKYFSQGSERIFERTKAIIGRKVVNCHPPASVHVVEQIVDDFKQGKREHADFWIQMGPRYVLIRYFAVRDDQGQFLGTLEVTQDIAPIQAIEGEKRLLS